MRRTLASKTLGYIKPRVNLQVDNLEVFLLACECVSRHSALKLSTGFIKAAFRA
jgi:hypothetical protein